MNKQNLSTPQCPYSIVIAIQPKGSAENSEIFNNFIVTECSPQSYHNSQEAAIEFGAAQLLHWVSVQHPKINEKNISCPFVLLDKFHADTILAEVRDADYKGAYYRKVQIRAGKIFYFARFYICYAGNVPNIPTIVNYLENGEGQDFTIDVIPAREVVDYRQAIKEIHQKWRLVKTKSQNKENDEGELALTK